MAKRQEQSKPAKLRLRREDCDRVKHDSLFSDWKILVGASDWQDHAAGKEGVSRYRLHNLPSPKHSLPGVYELGILPRTKSLVDGGKKPGRRIRREDVVAVYVGEAENVRQRLQRYGQAGSHLETAFVTTIKVEASMVQLVSPVARCAASEPSDLSAQNGALQAHQLFSRVFAQGRSIVFRWALTESKEVARRVELELLSVFDYAWNREKNGFRRPDDILSKLHLGEDSSRVSCHGAVSYLAYLKWILSGRQSRGIVVAASNPKEASKHRELITSSVLKASYTNLERKKTSNANTASSGQDEHKLPNNGAAEQGEHLDSSRKESEFKIEIATGACGFVSADGSECTVPPVKGRRRCSAHKGQRIKPPRRRETSQKDLGFPTNGRSASAALLRSTHQHN